MFTRSVCVCLYVYFCAKFCIEWMVDAENGSEAILCVCVNVTIDSIQNLTQTLKQTQTHTLRVHSALQRVFNDTGPLRSSQSWTLLASRLTRITIFPNIKLSGKITEFTERPKYCNQHTRRGRYRQRLVLILVFKFYLHRTIEFTFTNQAEKRNQKWAHSQTTSVNNSSDFPFLTRYGLWFRAHLHPATAMRLLCHCDVAPKWIVKQFPSNR